MQPLRTVNKNSSGLFRNLKPRDGLFFWSPGRGGTEGGIDLALWLVPTRSLPGARLPQVCNSTPVLQANRAHSDGLAPPAPALPAAGHLSPIISNAAKPEPQNKISPGILIWVQEKKNNQKITSTGGPGMATALHF